MPRSRFLPVANAILAAAAAAGVLAAPPVAAAPLLPGAEISPTGTSQALRPELRVQSQANTVRRFAVPDGAGGVVRGQVVDFVDRSLETGTLIFSHRIELDAGSSALARPAESTRSGLAIASTDADFRLDALGTVATDSMQRSGDGDRLRAKLVRALQPGASSRTVAVLTNALAYDEGGSIALFGPGMAAPVVVPAYRPVGTPQPYYTVTQVAVTDGWAFVNDHGQVSLTVGDAATGRRGAVWQPAGRNDTEGSVHLLPTVPGLPYSVAMRINNRGQVVGTGFLRPDASSVDDAAQRAFVFTPMADNQPAGSTVGLSGFPGGTHSNAWGINDAGQVTGGADHPGAPIGAGGIPGDDAVLWNADGIHSLGAPIAFGGARGINNAGAIAGYGAFGYGTYQGFVWTPERPGAGTGTARPVYEAAGARWTGPGVAIDINAAGVAIGAAQLRDADGSYLGSHGWLWSATGFTDLGLDNAPFGIDDNGVAVGVTEVSVGALFRGRIVTKLRYFTAPARGWGLAELMDINNAGQVVGYGGTATQPRQVVLLTPVRVSALGSCPATRTPFTLAVGGTGFAADAVVRLNGQPLPTTRIDSRTLTAAVPAGLGLGRPTLLVTNGDGSQSIPVSAC